MMVLALGATPAMAGPDGSVDLFANAVDPTNGVTGAVDFGSCQAPTTNVAGFFSKVAVSIYARLSGATAVGISGAELFVDGLQIGDQIPAGCTVTFTGPAATTVLGNVSQITDPGLPTESRRANITWAVDSPDDPDCQKDPLTFLGLLEIQTAFGDAGALDGVRRLQVVVSDPPTNPTFTSPTLLLCDKPAYTPVGVTGGEFIINPDAQNNCAVAVSEASWGAVKGLYR
jgi:hypothetical protein